MCKGWIVQQPQPHNNNTALNDTSLINDTYILIPLMLMQDLGAACGSHRPTCMVMVKLHEDYTDLYNECTDDVKGMPLPM